MALPISVGSGATLASNVFDGSHHQVISPVSLYPLPAGTNFIGLISAASIHGKVDVATALPTGGNFIGLATAVIGNTPAVSQSGTWNVGITGLTSLASGTNVGLNAGANFIGLTTTVLGGSLPAGTNFLGGVSIFGNIGTSNSGNVTLNPSPNYIGLVTTFPAAATTYIGLVSVSGNVAISNTPAVTQSGNWAISSLASGAHIRAYLETGSNFIGGVSVFGNLAANLAGNVTLNPSPNFIGLVTVGNNVPVIGDVASAATDSGNPVKIGGLYASTPATLTDGQRGNIQVTSRGAVKTTLFANDTNTTISAAVDNTDDVAASATANKLVVVNRNTVFDGSTWDRTPGNSTDGTLVNLGSNNDVTLNEGSNFIGGVSVFGSLSANLGGNVTLNPSPNFIGLTTTVLGGALPAGTNFLGGVSVFGSLSANLGGNVTLNPGPNFIGLVTVGNIPAVTQSGTWNVGVTGLISLASGTKVGLDTGTNFIGGVSVFGSLSANLGGNVTLNPSPNFIGLATVVIGGPINSGGVKVVPFDDGGNLFGTAVPIQVEGSYAHGEVDDGTYGPVKVGGRVKPVHFLSSLGSGYVTDAWFDTEGRLATFWQSGATISVGNSLPAGANFIGLATVVIGAGGAGDGRILDAGGTFYNSVFSTASGAALSVQIKGTTGITAAVSQDNAAPPTLGGLLVLGLDANAGTAHSIPVRDASNGDGKYAVMVNGAQSHGDPDNASFSFPIKIGGRVKPQNHIVSTASGTISAAWFDTEGRLGTFWQSGATISLGNSLPAGSNFIGLATVVQSYISNYTSLATVVSAAGNATIFVPPSGQRWIVKDLIIGAQGRTEVEIKSGANTLIPPISLATTSGYVKYFGDTGLRAKAVDNAFVVNILSAATTAVFANVRFE